VDVDEALVAEAARGNRDAFDVLVKRYQSPLFQLIRILTRGDEESEDLVQETFVRAYRAVHRFRGESTFKTWLHRIAVNVVRTHLTRRSGRRGMWLVETSEDEDAVAQLASADDLESAVVRRRMIDQALAQLPANLRLLVTLRDVQGLEYREIAAITRLPIGTVESRIFRTRRRLRPLLEPLLPRSSQRRTK
jgi:RNA polymerase sigma-70 factor (ECF subfamily)